MRNLHVADLFCGAGGTSIGAEQSGAASVKFAVNHWDVAVETHSANFPGALHVNSRLDQVSPGECPKIDLLFASPSCVHHSRARGGRPTSDQQRADAWDILPWVEHHRPSFVCIENVSEWRDWGPVGDNGRPLKKFRGRFFSAWVEAVASAGYRVDDMELNAADFGAATSRNRLFVVARKGNRRPVFPEPTHAKRPGNALPGMQRLPWRAASEIIDWEIPCPSVFARKRPLADKTLLRIEAGLRRFVEPFVMSTLGGGVARTIEQPTPTITTRGGAHCIVPLLSSYYGNGDCTAIDSPVPTIVTKDRHSLILATIDPCCLDWPAPHSDAMRSLQSTMRELGVADVGFRMLANHELAAAQGFPTNYIFAGNKSQVTRQVGNSVSPPVAKAITEELAA